MGAGRKVLVTGAGGFAGRALLPRLAAAGYGPVATDLLSGEDLTRAGALDRYLGMDISAVVHLAGRVFVPDSWRAGEEFMRVNAGGARTVAAFCAGTGARLLLVSAYVYGVPDYLPIDEKHPARPNNPYAASKLAAEEEARRAADAGGFPLVIVRPFNLYGAGQAETFLIPMLAAQVRAGRELTVRDAAPRRDYLHLDDFCSALLALLAAGEPWRRPVTYNVGYGRSWSVREIIELLQQGAGRPLRWQATGEPRTNEIADTVADCRALRGVTGWQPQVEFADGLARLIAEQ